MLISPSILSANFANLKKEILNLENSGADMIHIDVMDGHFVPNLTFGTLIIKTLKNITKLPLDVHLMISNPELSINQYIDSGADFITIHSESTVHLDRTLDLIKRNNVKAGLAIIPSANLDIIEYIIDKLSLILIMTVNPGFSGQKFLNNQIKKIKLAKSIIKDYQDIILSVDGGINDITAKDVIAAGADCLVAGSFIFNNIDNNYQQRIEILKNLS